jgi:CheY-like chemotaxis protein
MTTNRRTPRTRRPFGHPRRRVEDRLDREEGGRSFRILLVDDDPVNLAAFCRCLDRMGCTVEPASSGEYAVALYEQGCGADPFDLILIDLNMPGLDGCGTARRIRAAERRLPKSHACRRRPVPILALTSRNPESRFAACRRAGMNDFMYKPLNRETLVEALARWVPEPAFQP